MRSDLFVTSPVLYRPAEETEAPALEYLPSVFKRRLSQLCRMTIHAVHEILLRNPALDKAKTKLVFASFRGELGQEYKVNHTFATEHIVMPAAFSLSVYNAAIAQATIAFGLTGGYTAVYPQEGNFYSALAAAAAPLLCGDEKQLLFVFGDECIAAPYKNVNLYGSSSADKKPFAFAMLLNAEQGERAINIQNCKGKSAEEFIQDLMQ